ncbi:hypothetical protein HBA55_21110 [Pseudomaricurvus alkylphenolicus]|uniref:hypothetical protein n=1 Tax=Pseudomaricurvus alkylphenolicus TaxID=1306991 RepID=UPI001420FC47|nr:hypothetical protein [Pseudomaricurvus alkylphenolicus]NIB42119.1 hypothetical protein [Pseudomaricurvus alkylphenolicus]
MKALLVSLKKYATLRSAIATSITISLTAYAVIIQKKEADSSTHERAPFFHVKEEQLKNPTTEMYDNSVLSVTHAGTLVNNIKARARTYVQVLHAGDEYTETLVPVVGYYSASFPTSNPTGLITEFTDPDNHAKLFALNQSALEHSKRHDVYVNLKLHTLVTIEYTGQDRLPGTAYFLNTELVSSDEVQHLQLLSREPILVDLKVANLTDLLDAARRIEALGLL